jgi:siroheme synthase (precorrin-2 oxidase/ferrochelatase)
MYGKLYAIRRRGRPNMRWLDDVSTDLRKMVIKEWRERAKDRETWRRIAKEAKAHPGCSATEEEVIS